MFIHSVLLVIHVLSAVIWLGFFPVEIFLRKNILQKLTKNKSSDPDECSNEMISNYLNLSSLTGKIGLIGILFTGVTLTIYLPYYSLFDFSDNHWLAAKQVVMVVIILLVGFVFMKRSKELRMELTQNSSKTENLSERKNELVRKLGGVSTIINILVLLNFLFAITKRFLGV